MAFTPSSLSMQHFGPGKGGIVYYFGQTATDTVAGIKAGDYFDIPAVTAENYFEVKRAVDSLVAFVTEREHSPGAGLPLIGCTGDNPAQWLRSFIVIEGGKPVAKP